MEVAKDTPIVKPNTEVPEDIKKAALVPHNTLTSMPNTVRAAIQPRARK